MGIKSTKNAPLREATRSTGTRLDHFKKQPARAHEAAAKTLRPHQANFNSANAAHEDAPAPSIRNVECSTFPQHLATFPRAAIPKSNRNREPQLNTLNPETMLCADFPDGETNPKLAILGDVALPLADMCGRPGEGWPVLGSRANARHRTWHELRTH